MLKWSYEFWAVYRRVTQKAHNGRWRREPAL